MEPTVIPPDNSDIPSLELRQFRRRLAIIVVVAILLVGGLFYVAKARNQFSFSNPFRPDVSQTPSPAPDPDYAMPINDPNRLNVLVMGIEGQSDSNASVGGPLLTDSIQIFSYNKPTHKSSLISIPRDLLAKIHDDKIDKINTYYQYGFYHSSNSLQFVKDSFSRLSGVYIDNILIFDFSSFKDIVNALGGVDVTLDAPFSEPHQWGFPFSLPAGVNHLDGQNALYYARSRFSSTDFDRSRRQQQIMFAIKDKLFKLNFLSDPVKSFSVLNLIHNDIKTDIGIWNIKEYLDLSGQVKFSEMKRTIISTDNLVVEGRGADGAYVLLPKGGNFSAIKQLFQNSLK